MAALTPLQVAELSPQAVGRQDMRAWLALFTDDARVQDPVGGPVHSDLEAFWRVFIQGNDIRFEVHHDHVDGDEVFRDLTIHTRFPLGASLAVPCHLRYRVRGERLVELDAHWELLSMSWQATLAGPRAWWDSTLLSLRMLRFLGLGGTLRYLAGAFGAGAAGRRLALTRCAELGLEPSGKLIASGPWVTVTVLRQGRPGLAWFRVQGSSILRERVVGG